VVHQTWRRWECAQFFFTVRASSCPSVSIKAIERVRFHSLPQPTYCPKISDSKAFIPPLLPKLTLTKHLQGVVLLDGQNPYNG
jgi:hypothetical protein